MGLVNEAVPKARLRSHTRELAKVLIAKLIFQDPERGRQKAMQQFLDDKTFRPGLGNYDRSK